MTPDTDTTREITEAERLLLAMVRADEGIQASVAAGDALDDARAYLTARGLLPEAP